MVLQEQYIVEQIHENARRVKQMRASRVYNFECPICNEGKSRGKKRRGYYIPEQNTICCHNCHWKSNPIKWIQEVTNKSFYEIKDENSKFYSSAEYIIERSENITKTSSFSTLPEDSINLYSETEVSYYINNDKVKSVIDYCKKRKLFTARNKPDALYFSLKDKIYKDSLCFPFFNRQNKIDFFQVREMGIPKGSKYRGKLNAEKSIFNVNKIDPNFPYIFMFEGPIDSMFVNNGVALAGVSLTHLQKQMLAEFPFHQKIWVLDNQHIDNTAKDITLKLLEQGQDVFIWPKKYSSFKDLNELCCHYDIDGIGAKIILDNVVNNKIAAVVKGLTC